MYESHSYHHCIVYKADCIRTKTKTTNTDWNPCIFTLFYRIFNFLIPVIYRWEDMGSSRPLQELDGRSVCPHSPTQTIVTHLFTVVKELHELSATMPSFTIWIQPATLEFFWHAITFLLVLPLTALWMLVKVRCAYTEGSVPDGACIFKVMLSNLEIETWPRINLHIIKTT